MWVCGASDMTRLWPLCAGSSYPSTYPRAHTKPGGLGAELQAISPRPFATHSLLLPVHWLHPNAVGKIRYFLPLLQTARDSRSKREEKGTESRSFEVRFKWLARDHLQSGYVPNNEWSELWGKVSSRFWAKYKIPTPRWWPEYDNIICLIGVAYVLQSSTTRLFFLITVVSSHVRVSFAPNPCSVL